MVKLYWSIWSAVALLALMLYAFGNFSPLTTVAFGFICFGLTFMGMIGVLPTMVSHPPAAPAKPIEPEALAYSVQQPARSERGTQAVAH